MAVDPIIEKIAILKSELVRTIVDRPATYHACDVLASIAGWELASKEDRRIDLPKKVKEIYAEAAD